MKNYMYTNYMYIPIWNQIKVYNDDHSALSNVIDRNLECHTEKNK